MAELARVPIWRGVMHAARLAQAGSSAIRLFRSARRNRNGPRRGAGELSRRRKTGSSSLPLSSGTSQCEGHRVHEPVCATESSHSRPESSMNRLAAQMPNYGYFSALQPAIVWPKQPKVATASAASKRNWP